MKYPSNEVYVLEGPAAYQKISEVNFRRIVGEGGSPAVVTFSSNWMGGAAMLHLLMEDMWAEYSNKAYFFCVDLEKSKLAKEFSIVNTATICFFYKGEMVDQQVGLVSKSKLRKKLEDFIQRLS